MPRVKSPPLRSLDEIDYTNPNLVIWFFGQPPQKNKRRNESISSSNEDKNEKKVNESKKSRNAHSGTQNSESSNETTVIKQENGVDPKKKNLKHPLSIYPDIPNLTDLQVFMTEAIISEEGNSAHFEKIYEYVSKRWRSIKRRDGSHYTTDCRRAIQANLRHNPNHIALFRRDRERGDGYWTVCNTFEEAAQASKERQAERRNSKRASERNRPTEESRDGGSEAEEADAASEGEANALNNNATPNGNGIMNGDVQESSNDASIIPTPVNSAEAKEEKANGENAMESSDITSNPASPMPSSNITSMSELQEIIVECIKRNEGSCHFDLIYHYVTKNWKKKGTQDSKAAILSILTAAKPAKLFKRDPKRTGWWMVNMESLNGFEGIDGKKDGRRRALNGRKNLPEISIENSEDPTESYESSEDKKDLPNEISKKKKFRLIK